MIQDAKLFTVRKFDFHLRHLLVIGILIISFSISAMVRSQAADYGFQLNEFDPFFNYRATQYLLDNGLDAYVHWHDTMSWYPAGRDVFDTAQVPLHVTDAVLYKIFGGGMSLYDFTIIFPVVFGSMTVIVIFALVRVLGGTSAGLFASLFFALSPPIIVRGTIGWFKSEPLGLFYGLLGVYLFLSGLKSKNKKVAAAKMVGGGFFLATGFASWGGIEFFLLPLGLFFVALPFIRKDHNFLLWAVPLFVAVTMVISGGLFARPGPTFVFGMRGFAMIGPTILLVIIIFIQKYSKEQHRMRNSLLALAALVIIGGMVLSSGAFHSTSFRYLNAMDPFLTSEDPLVDSVAEHATPTLAQNFSYFSVLMLFAGLGIWLVFRKKNGDENTSKFSLRNEMIVFALIIGIVGAYSGSTFSRLELLTATSVIILSSIGLAILVTDILKKENKQVKVIESSNKGTTRTRKETTPIKKTSDLLGRIPKIAFVAVIVALFLVPTLYPVNGNWISITKSPPTILNGGSNFAISTSDWPDALNWLKTNTPKDSVVASWWDYGYWIQTLGERTTIADNATVDTNVIANIARMLLDSPDEAWKALKKMGANYVLVYVVGQKFVSNGQDLYVLGGGGDESKKQWFMKIGGLDSSKFLQDDAFTPTDYFWQNTLLGQMFPFTPLTYYDSNTHNESPTYTTGYTAIYSKTIKYPSNGNGPLRLVYSSASLNRTDSGVFSGVLIYQVNPDYQSQNVTSSTNSNSQGSGSVTPTIKPTTTTSNGGNIAVIDTKFGEIKFKFFNNVAPQTTTNFVNLANSGFYDGTVFHRIIPGFMIQGGDPNTIKGDRSTWGLGDSGHTIPPEFSSNMNFTKYMVGMARSTDVNSGSSQFFITVGDAPWLNNQYTLFGQVVSGQDVVDKIAALQTDPATNQPVDADAARVSKISIESSNSTTK
ncbi:peptidylprolyl isomerase [Candidatus Nitrosotalea bavarica]|uniref:peptidylprolyl isomerase n=1 Tax=Candidatus Nitrosotalea bavarica TaxID=1903277 RepID=UPI001FE94315|nr:peptidylprolyl isomerase [Candidatus Nitrosotalea bavarica]